MLCCQKSIQRIQKYFFKYFFDRNLFLNTIPDVEVNIFGPLKTLYSQKRS